MDKILFSQRLSEKRKEMFKNQRLFAKAYTKRFPPKIRDESGGNEPKCDGILGSIKHYENPNYSGKPTLETVDNMCQILDCDVDYLLGHIDEKNHDLHFICEYTGLSEPSISGLHDIIKKNPLIIEFFDEFIKYCGLHGKILQKVMYATDSNRHINNETDFTENTFFFSQSLKKTLNPTGKGSISLPLGTVPLPADDAREYYIDQATRYFREFLSDFIDQSSGESE